MGTPVGKIERTATVREVEATLTPIEFDLLDILMRSPGRVFTRTELVDRLTDSGFTGLDSTLFPANPQVSTRLKRSFWTVPTRP